MGCSFVRGPKTLQICWKASGCLADLITLASTVATSWLEAGAMPIAARGAVKGPDGKGHFALPCIPSIDSQIPLACISNSIIVGPLLDPDQIAALQSRDPAYHVSFRCSHFRSIALLRACGPLSL